MTIMQNDMKSEGGNVMFDMSKNNEFDQHGFKVLARKLRLSGYKVMSNKEDLTNDILNHTSIYIIASPRGSYSETELSNLKKYINGGGKLWIMMTEGGDKRFSTNINSFAKNFGITLANDAVIRNSYYKYFHPKEALVSNGILNRGMLSAANKLRANSNTANSGNNKANPEANLQTINYVYPYGCTLNVTRPAIGVMSTGSVCYPLNRPTVAFYSENSTSSSNSALDRQSSRDNFRMGRDKNDLNGGNGGDVGTEEGKFVVTGSSAMFTDSYIEKEDNSLIRDIIIEFLTQPHFPLDQIDADDPEVSDYHTVPDISLLAGEPLSCLQETEDVPSDYTKLFSREIYSIDNTPLAKVIAAYTEFNMIREPLKLIKPQFESPLPPLEPAVFPPNLRIPSRPALELFDLDQEFSSAASRLNQIANKCTDADLEYYVKECSLVLGVPDAERMSSKEILEYIFKRIVLYKKVNDDPTISS
ncbi:intraflagellar transport 52 [Brevipalpus obovatus]|uniref:intraflagellar transport 52 n=1 Tax=Brevipalpus obovatus TaxID=246614 RepID=UPI003D9EDD68